MNLFQKKLIQNPMFILELEYETTITPLKRLTTLSLSTSEEVLPPTHLDLYGFKMVMDVRSSLGDLQGVAFQHPMKCKKKNMIWEGDSLHWKGTKIEHDGRHLHVDGWVWMVRKTLESYFKIYDTG